VEVRFRQQGAVGHRLLETQEPLRGAAVILLGRGGEAGGGKRVSNHSPCVTF